MRTSDFGMMSRRDFLRIMGTIAATGATATTLSACDGLFPKPQGDEEDKPKGMASLVTCKGHNLSMFLLDPIQSSSTEVVELLLHVSAGLARWRIVNGVVTVTPELAEELVTPTQNANGTVTYVYSIAEGAVWSDGKPITAQDFVYSWNRAANIKNNAVFRELFDCIEGYSDATDMRLAVVAEDDRTLSVTLTHDLPYWNDLLAFTPFFPIREDAIGNDYAWMTDVKSFPYSGPYIVAEYAQATYGVKTDLIRLTKREDYLYADDITVEEIRYVFGMDEAQQLKYISDSDSSNKIFAEDGDEPETVHVLDHATMALLQASKDIKGVKRRATPLLGSEWLIWNVNKRLLPESLGLVGDAYEQAQADVRHAFALLIDREKLVSQIYGYTPAPSIVPPGMSDQGGSDFSSNAGPSSEYAGYIDTREGSGERNRQMAIDILRKYYPYDETTGKFSGFPDITFCGSGTEIGPAATELMNAGIALGIPFYHNTVEYSTLIDYRMNGEFDFSYGNWYADFTDPITFLSLWRTASDLNSCQLGRGTHAGARIYSLDFSSIGEETTVTGATWAEAYDVLMNRISTESDRTKRLSLLHQAEDLLMSTWCIMPVWFPATAYIVKDNIAGLEPLPFNWIFYGHATEES